MKKLLFIALFLAPALLIAQEKEKTKDQSKLASFSSTTGTLIKKAFGSAGKIGTSEIQTSVLTSLTSDEKIKGIRIEKRSGQYARTAIAFIDEDEIEGLLQSIQLIREKIMPTSPSEYTEVNYQSRSGFQFGCFYSKNKWSFFYQVDRYDSDAYVWLNINDLDNFEEIIVMANDKLKTL